MKSRSRYTAMDGLAQRAVEGANDFKYSECLIVMQFL